MRSGHSCPDLTIDDTNAFLMTCTLMRFPLIMNICNHDRMIIDEIFEIRIHMHCLAYACDDRSPSAPPRRPQGDDPRSA